jgi:hypothetical protein
MARLYDDLCLFNFRYGVTTRSTRFFTFHVRCKTDKVKRTLQGLTDVPPPMSKSVSECIVYSSVIISVFFSYMRSRPIYRLSDKYLYCFRVLFHFSPLN